jgi:hypothetical protein
MSKSLKEMFTEPKQNVSNFLINLNKMFKKPDRVFLKDIDPGSPSIGRPLAEDVTHVRAGDDLQCAVTHPSLEKS